MALLLPRRGFALRTSADSFAQLLASRVVPADTFTRPIPRLRFLWFDSPVKYAVAVATALGVMSLSACGSDESAAPESTPTPATAAPTTTKKLTGDDLFVQKLRDGGIFPTVSQVSLLTPLARQNCSALGNTTLPDSQKFDKMVELSMILGEGKNIIDNQVTAEAYMKASIAAYCPQYLALIPA